MAKRIVLTGGGTAGHIRPLVTVADYIRKNRNRKIDFLFLGPSTELERKIMDESNIPQKSVMSGKIRRYFSLLYFVDVFKLIFGFIQALWRLFWFMPDAVFAKGGFASVPVVVAAKLYRIPVLIHESDAVPGMANKFLGSISNRIALTFDRAKMYFPEPKTIVIGNPVREEVLNGNEEEGRRVVGMKKEYKPVIFFIGGSQGAQIINERILLNLNALLKKYQIIHQTGEKNIDFAKKEAQRKGCKIGHSDYYPIGFIGDEIKHFFALADVVVSRAGSTSISEIAANKKPSILIPIAKSANGHQRINAFEVSKAGGAVALEEKNFKKNILIHEIDKILGNEKFRNKLILNVEKFYHPEATKTLAKELLSLI